MEGTGDRTGLPDELAEELGSRAPLDNQSYAKGSWHWYVTTCVFLGSDAVEETERKGLVLGGMGIEIPQSGL